ncbi:MAG: hypothetical protein PHS14_03040 [Elusimicrobia bacterium]|nr:hypothetical protein [Elusimicrobiota bacterium]
MNRLMLAGLLAGLCAAPGRAENNATIGARYVDLDSKGNKQQALEYDGKLYYGAHGDVSVGNESELGLFDFSLKDIGSREEVMNFNLDYKSTFKASAKWDNLHHRMNQAARSGQVINGVWRPNNVALTTGNGRFTFVTGAPINFSDDPNMYNFMLKRTESEVNVGLFSPENSAKWITAQYWSVVKTGSRYVQTATNVLGEANVDNTQENYTLGLGTNIKEDGAVAVDLIRADFVDNAKVVLITPSNPRSAPLLPQWPRHEMTAVESKWKYNVSKKLSLTGAITGRQRENLVNRYQFNAGVAAFNAAYKATSKLALTAKTYFRYSQIHENQGFMGFNTGAAAPRLDLGQGNAHEFDKLTARGEFEANYHPCEKFHGKAVYKVELNHRRDAPSEDFALDTTYADGLVVPGLTRSNNLSNEDVKHVMEIAGTVELPLGAELEGQYKKLYANRPAFVNMPTRQDEVGAQFMMPLPAHVEFTLGGTYSKERNAKEATNYHMTRNNYRAGLDWEGASKVFVGVDGSYEIIRYNSETYYATSNFPGSVTAAQVNAPHESGQLNRQRNTTLGAHGRVNLPKGLVILGNGSYTWSVVQNPVNFGWTAAQAASQFTPAGTFVNDIMPSEVRVARGTLGMEYTPEKYKNLTARASYSITDWVDKVDSYNSGRASIAQVGASMKF